MVLRTSPLASPQLGRLANSLGNTPLRRELTSLGEETDPNIFSSDLLSLARHQEENRNYPIAHQLYQEVITSNPNGTWGERAQRRMRVLEGGGNLFERLEFLGREFLPQVLDPGLFAGMFVGARVFRGVSGGILRQFTRPTFASRSLAWSLGLSAEVPAFVLANRGVHTLQGHNLNWTGAALRQELQQVGLTLFALKSFGAMGHGAMGRIGNSPGLSPGFVGISQKALPQFAMLTGIMAAHGAELTLGWRPHGDPGIFLVESLATLIQFNAAGNLVRPFQGRPIPNANRSVPRVPRLLAPLRPWVQAVTPEGITIGPPRFFSVNNSPSSIPPPSSGSVRARVPKSSGVRNFETDGPFRSLRRKFTHLEGDIYSLFSQETLEGNETAEILRINSELTQATRELSEARDLPEIDLSELTQAKKLLLELDNIKIFLQAPETQTQTAEPFSFSFDREGLDEFLTHYYRYPNRMVNFFNGEATLEGPHQAIEKARLSLEILQARSTLTQEFQLDPTLRQLYIDQSHRLAGELFKLYSEPQDGLWAVRSLKITRGFQKMLGRTQQRLQADGSRPTLLEDTSHLMTDLKEIYNILMNAENYARHPSFENVPRNFIMNFYQAPNSMADFFMEGDPKLLRSARIHTRQARINLEELEISWKETSP